MAATGGRAKEKCTLRHRASVQAVCVLPRPGMDLMSGDDKIRIDDHEQWLVATGDALGRVAVWDMGLRRAIANKDFAHCGNYGVMSVCALDASGASNAISKASSSFNPSIPLLLSQGRDGFVRVWDWASLGEIGSPVWEINTGSSDFCAAACLGPLIAGTASEGEEIKVWRALCPSDQSVTISKPQMWDENGGEVNTGMCMDLRLVAVEQRQLLLGLFENGWLYTYDLGRGDWVSDLGIKLFDGVPISFDLIVKANDTKVLGVSCGVDSRIVAFALSISSRTKDKAKVKATVQLRSTAKEEEQDESTCGFSAVRIAPNTRVVACACWDGSVRLVDWKRLEPLGNLTHHSKVVRSLAFSPDTTMLISVGEDSHAVCWNLPFTAATETKGKDQNQNDEAKQKSHEGKLKQYEILPPRMIRYKNSDIEISAHLTPKTLLRDVALVFSEALRANPKLDKSNLKLVPTIQETKMSLLKVSDDTALEKDHCLEVFDAFAKHFCNLLRERGYWADFFDPCSGLPMFCNSNTTYSEIHGLEKLRSFRTTHSGSCRVAFHPIWGPNMYPATISTDATVEEIANALNKLDTRHTASAIDIKLPPGSPSTMLLPTSTTATLPTSTIATLPPHQPARECRESRPWHPWFAAQAAKAVVEEEV